MRRVLVGIAVLGLLVFLFWGCSKEEEKSDTEKLQEAINGEYS